MSWKKVKLGDVCRIEKGATGILKAIPGEYPMVVTSEERKSHNEYQFDDEAVIIPLVSGTGHGHASIKRIHFQNGKFALGSILCAVIPKDKKQLSAEYLYRFLDLNKDNELVARMKGMANVTLPMKEIAQIEMPLPSLKEQYKFVESYKALEYRSQELSNEFVYQLSLVKKLRQQLLQDAVQGRLLSQDKNDTPVSELLKKIREEKETLVLNKKTKNEFSLHKKSKKSPPFDIPSNWSWVRFWDIAWCFRGHNPSKIHFIKQPKKGYVRFIQITDFKTDAQAVYVPITKQLKYVFKGEIIMAAYRHIGKFSTNMEGAFNVALCKINNIEPFYRNYLAIVIKSELITGELLAASERGHIPSMHSEHLLSLWVPVPPLAEQHRIVAKLEELMQKCDELEASIQASKEQNEQLLQQVLREALQGNKENRKIGLAEIKPGNASPSMNAVLPVVAPKEDKAYFKRKVLANYVINQSLNDPHFGDTKFEKELHLIEHTLKRNLGQNYFQHAAGPYDNAFTHAYFTDIEKGGLYTREKINGQYVFGKGPNHGKTINYYNYFSAEELTEIDRIIKYFKTKTYEQPEIVSTLYAVWNNRIIKQEQITDELLFADFYAWDKQKAKYKQSRLESALAWMRETGIVPEGWGKFVGKSKKKKVK